MEVKSLGTLYAIKLFVVNNIVEGWRGGSLYRFELLQKWSLPLYFDGGYISFV